MTSSLVDKASSVGNWCGCLGVMEELQKSRRAFYAHDHLDLYVRYQLDTSLSYVHRMGVDHQS